MTRKYTNSKDELITVSQEHLDQAVQIKLELQELVPSRRTNWKEHRRLMEAAGYYDSDTNENYRCIVKDHQRSIGRLANADKFADKVADGKLDALRYAVGEMYLEKQDVLKTKRELNKIKREMTVPLLLADEYRNALLEEITIKFPLQTYSPPLPSSSNKLVVIITDWHIGATVHNSKGNSYNFEIAKKRINKYKAEILRFAALFNVTDVTVACLGDMVEHVSMRNVNQSFEAEFPLAHQIVKATQIITDFLVSLAQHVNVEYFGIAGNHDRFQGSKNDAIDGDNVMIVINENLKTFIELANLPRLSFDPVCDSFNYEHTKTFNSKTIKFVHGDFEQRNDKNKLSAHISGDEQFYDALVMGHYHTYKVEERNFGRMEIIVGSPMGRNFYSRKFKGNSNAGQAVLIITEKDLIPIRIDLQEE